MYRYQPLLFQPVPSLLGYSASELVEEIRAVHFPELDEQVEVRFAADSPLAYMATEFMGRGRHLLVFHPVLNHPQTPIEVMRLIAKHELTHIVRPPRIVGRFYETHPPEFWEHEAAIGPERHAVWAWTKKNLRKCTDATDSSFRVTGAWRSLRNAPRTPYTPSLPFDGERWEHLCPGGGAQLQLPPDWAVKPLPLAT